MAIDVCPTCPSSSAARLVPGPRNMKRSMRCRFHGLYALALEDMLNAEEADELNKLLTPRTS